MTPFDFPLWIVLVFLFLFGCCIGSFLNVCVHRIPQHDRLWDQLRGLNSPPSRCPKCLTRISTRDNVPILGWLFLRGKCRKCGLSISIRYPLVELFNGLLFVIVYLCEVPDGYLAKLAESCVYADIGPQIVSGWSETLHVNLRYVYHMVLLEALLVASLIDWDLKIIPDGSTVPAMLVGFAGAFTIGHVNLVPVWYQDPSFARAFSHLLPEPLQLIDPNIRVPEWTIAHPHLHGLAVSLAGFIVGGGLVWGVRILGQWILRREAMGFGDVILLAMIGSFIGWQPVVIVFFLAPLCAMVFILCTFLMKKQREIPYGPYLSLAALFVILFFHRIWPFWEKIFSTGLMVPVIAIVGTVVLAVSLFGIQLVKRILGIPLYDPEEVFDEWNSADQLGYQYSENHDRLQGRWKTEQWPGVDAGQGTGNHSQWRNGSSPDWKTVQRRQ